MTHTLTYFDLPGRAFMVRVALHAAGIDFVDERLDFPTFGARKAEGKYPLGVPICKLPNGHTVGQSNALMRYAAKQGGLYPEDPILALYADAFVDTCADASNNAPQVKDPAEKQAAREAYAKGKLKLFCEELERLANLTEGNKFVVGDSLTIADLANYFAVGMIARGHFDFIPPEYVDAYPTLKAIFENTQSHPTIVSWNEKVAAAKANKAAEAAAAEKAAAPAAEGK